MQLEVLKCNKITIKFFLSVLFITILFNFFPPAKNKNNKKSIPGKTKEIQSNYSE